MFKEGDYAYSYWDDEYHLMKVLVVETFNTDDGETHQLQHCMLFKASKTKPTPKNVDQFEVFVWHVPITLREDEYTYVTNRAVTKDELYGYETYLEMMSQE